MRPVAHPANKTMLHGIKVNVIDMPLEIFFVADRVFPEPWLPERDLAVSVTRHGRSGLHDPIGEPALDLAQSIGEIGVAVRQRRDDVQVVRQHHNRIDREGMSPSGHSHGRTQRADVIEQSAGSPIRERGREKERSAREEIAPVSDHARRISRISRCSIQATAVLRSPPLSEAKRGASLPRRPTPDFASLIRATADPATFARQAFALELDAKQLIHKSPVLLCIAHIKISTLSVYRIRNLPFSLS